MLNTILARRVNHIVAKGDNPAWPKGSKSRGFSSYKGKPIPSIERRRKREFQLLYIP